MRTLHNPSRPRRQQRRLLLSSITIGIALSAWATAQESGSDEIIELSPFEVNSANDRGYTATSSLAGGRLSTELRDTAATISVFTAEFLDDLAVTNFLEAAKWAPNSVPQEEVAGPNLYNDFSVNFRGMGLGFQSRNYFRWYINSDAYNTERIEFSRGPNSLVFGDAGVGGVANVSSKQARGTNQVSLEGSLSSYGGYRATLDADYGLSDAIDLRIALLHQDLDDWHDVGGDERDGVFATTTIRPTRTTTLRIEGEWGELDRVLTYNALDQMSNWDGVTTNPGFIGRRDPVPNSLARYNSTRLVYNSARPDLGIIDLEGFAATSGTFGDGLLTEPQEGKPDFAVIPGGDYDFSLQAPNAGVNNPYWTTSAFLNQRFGEKLFLEVAMNYQEQERNITRWFFDQLYIEVNETLPNGDPNPYLGDVYGWARYWNNTQRNEVFDVRASLAYMLDTKLTRQRLLVVAGHRDDRFEDHNYELVRSNGTNPDVRNATNRIFAYRYLSDGSVPTLTPPESDPVSGIESGYAKTNGFFSEKPITYFQAAASGSWFEGQQLNTLIGVRLDNYQEWINDAALNQRDPVTQELYAFGPGIKTDDQDVTSYTASAMYHLTGQFGLGAAYSESFDPGSTARAIDGSSLEPLLNNGLELSLKFELLEKRLVGSLIYYQSEQENNRISGQATPINEIWGLLNLNENRVQENYTDRQTNSGDGWELEFTAMPTDNWRVMFNIAFPQTEITSGFEDTRSYHAENVDFWNAEADRLEQEGQAGTASSIRTRIASIESAIESVAEGRTLNNTFDYTANLFTRYFFSEGVLKGFSLGGGVNLRGERVVGNVVGAPYDYIYADSYELYSLVMGYDRDIGQGSLSVQLNVNNVLDDEIVRRAPLGFTVQNPREFVLTVRYTF